MIIDFAVTNFRSFRAEQRLSFVSSNYVKELPENLIDPQLPGLDGLKLLKAVGVYGANAAGKTNVLRALNFLSHFVENSATELDEGDETGVEPFVLCAECPDQPSEFALRFVVEGVRYHFALIVDRRRVLFESLSAFPEGVERVWYERSWNEDAGDYEWSPKRPTGFKRDPNIVGYTRRNALFLSTAAKWNNEQIAPVYRWFKQQIRFLRVNADFPPMGPGPTASYMNRGSNERNAIVRLLRHGDVGILSAKATEHQITKEELPPGLPEELFESILKDGKRVEVSLGHRGAEGREFPLRWEDESSGTQKLFSLAGPWLDILKHGFVVGVDEVESSMHPMMVVELLRLVFDPERNRHGAQFVFTTHNPLLLDPTLLRRDQIWFADKDDGGATHLYPLTDYKPRKGESLVRGYLAGRYGAVPFIPNGLLGKEDADGE
ncbi:MAG: AAA family ATPase [Verrucomicrobia bacterium]|nr:AAA family ATPase [Verrucomicrobiota bacterium]